MTKSRQLQPPRQIWTKDQIETLRINYANWPTYLVAHVCGHSLSSTYGKARELGLAKSAEFLAKPESGRLQHDDARGVSARFPKGNVPANKGLRRPGWTAGRMAETQFKKGRTASESRNYVPIGTEKYDPKRKVLMRKVTDDPSIFPVKRWRPVHVLVWEAARGQVAAGHIIVFRPGMKTYVAGEITADRLEQITLAENMRRNTIHNYPQELKQVIRLQGKLRRTIAKRTEAATP